MKLEDPSDYINCAEIWIEYPCRFFGRREVCASIHIYVSDLHSDRSHAHAVWWRSAVIARRKAICFDLNKRTSRARQINAFLGDIVKHMQPDRVYERFMPQLQSVLSKLLGHIHDFKYATLPAWMCSPLSCVCG
jgi:hypothetical protein